MNKFSAASGWVLKILSMSANQGCDFLVVLASNKSKHEGANTYLGGSNASS